MKRRGPLLLTLAVLFWPAAAAPSSLVAPPIAGQASPPHPAATQAARPREAARPKVRLITTGGTIANQAGGRLSAEQLIELVPQLKDYVRPETEQFSNVSSSSLTLGQWLALSRRLTAVVTEEPDLAGVVVTSGTDTLEELAYFLHLTVRTEKPIVVVGAMRRPGVLGYEGAANLLQAFRVAADPQAGGKGTLVVLNDEIHSAREVTKTDAQRLNTFQTRGYGVLGIIDTDRIVFHYDLVKRHSARSEFDLAGVQTLPRVDVLLTYQDAPGDLLKAAADNGAKGIVLATAAGATSGTQSEGALHALDKHVVIVRTTRTGSGRIAPADPDSRPPTSNTSASNTNNTSNTNNAAGATGNTGNSTSTPSAPSGSVWRNTVAGEDLSPIKARILLMLALTRTTDVAQIQRMFREY